MTSSSSSPPHLFGQPTQLVHVRGHDIATWRMGQGPALVFIHGWPLDSRTWRHSVEALGETFTCHLVDLPGQGLSTTPAGCAPGLHELADLMVEVIEALELGERFGLIAQDSGGGIARLVAARMPGRIAGLALGNTEVPGRYSWRFKLLFKLGALRSSTSLASMFLGSSAGKRLLFGDAVSSKQTLSEVFDMFIRQRLHQPSSLQSLLDYMKGEPLSVFDTLREAHARIDSPVKLIWGVDDLWLPLSDCKKMLGEFAGEVTLVEVPDAKLLVQEDQPERFNREVREHFARAF